MKISKRRRILRREVSRFLAVGASAVALATVLLAQPAYAGTFTVTNTNDSGPGSLRQAILSANADPGADRIEFDLPDTDDDNPVTGAEIISPVTALPVVTGPVTVDGYSQPGARENTRATGAIDAVIQVELNGFNVERGSGLEIETSNVVVRGLAINRFPAHGVEIGSGAGARIEGNLIGTDSTGNLDRGNTSIGVQIDGGGDHAVGGTVPETRNLISGNNGVAVEISNNSRGGNRVQGNLMGTQRNAFTPIGGSAEGLFIEAPDNTIGGSTPGAANVIAHNFGNGVEVFGVGNTGNRILGNSIHSNGGLGIDLSISGTFGRTANDRRDPDAGSNNLQNFPVLTFAAVAVDTTTIRGTLDSTPSTNNKRRTFTMQFFANPQGEDAGKTFLGQKRVTTNSRGRASFTFEVAEVLSGASQVTATATGPGGNTSEFSDPVEVARL